MTSEQIRSAIDRLTLENGREKMTTFSVFDAFVGEDAPKASDLCVTLIELLEQADPDTHIELPVDADGEVIHVGDVMRWPDGVTFNVVGVGNGVFFYNDRDGAWCTSASDKTHYHAPTIEDVLTDFGHKWQCMEPSLEFEMVAEYAAKLREVMADE